jgi:hypothetical protein
MTVTKIFCGNRETHRLKDEKGNLIPFSRVLRNGPKAFYSFIRSACVQTALQRIKPDAILYLDNSDKYPHGGDARLAEEWYTRLTEEWLLTAARERGGRVLYFTDFAPTDLFVNQGMMVLLGRFASAV